MLGANYAPLAFQAVNFKYQITALLKVIFDDPSQLYDFDPHKVAIRALRGREPERIWLGWSEHADLEIQHLLGEAGSLVDDVLLHGAAAGAEPAAFVDVEELVAAMGELIPRAPDAMDASSCLVTDAFAFLDDTRSRAMHEFMSGGDATLPRRPSASASGAVPEHAPGALPTSSVGTGWSFIGMWLDYDRFAVPGVPGVLVYDNTLKRLSANHRWGDSRESLLRVGRTCKYSTDMSDRRRSVGRPIRLLLA